MNKISELLKTTRIEKGLSLKDIAFETKINLGFLENLEENNIELLPQKSYTRGFVRSYAHHLQLNTEDILLEFNNTMGSTIPTPHKEQIQKNTWKTIPIIGRFRINRINLSIGIIAITIALILGAQSIISKYTNESEVSVPQPTQVKIMSTRKLKTK